MGRHMGGVICSLITLWKVKTGDHACDSGVNHSEKACECSSSVSLKVSVPSLGRSESVTRSQTRPVKVHGARNLQKKNRLCLSLCIYSSLYSCILLLDTFLSHVAWWHKPHAWSSFFSSLGLERLRLPWALHVTLCTEADGWVACGNLVAVTMLYQCSMWRLTHIISPPTPQQMWQKYFNTGFTKWHDWECKVRFKGGFGEDFWKTNLPLPRLTKVLYLRGENRVSSSTPDVGIHHIFSTESLRVVNSLQIANSLRVPSDTKLLRDITPWELFFGILEAVCALEMSRKERHFQGITRDIRKWIPRIHVRPLNKTQPIYFQLEASCWQLNFCAYSHFGELSSTKWHDECSA